jgi:GNAT superfamily N-acetyltransferase
MDFHLRPFDPAADAAAGQSFIRGSQAYEGAMEGDRRLDPAVGADYYAVLMREVAEYQGRVFIVEAEGRAVGWGIFHLRESPVYVLEDQRMHGYIAELYVEEPFRGKGAGRALIAACEDEARRLGMKHVMLGVLAENRRSADIYRQAGFADYAVELRKYL